MVLATIFNNQLFVKMKRQESDDGSTQIIGHNISDMIKDATNKIVKFHQKKEKKNTESRRIFEVLKSRYITIVSAL